MIITQNFKTPTIIEVQLRQNLFLVVKERVQNRQISIYHIGTDSMLANPFTKGFAPKAFHEHNAHMGVFLIYNTLV